MEITGKDLQYLKESYKHETNKVLAKRMGMSTSSISRLARNFGLQKSREHLLEVKRESIARATRIKRTNNWPPKGYIIPGSEKHRFKKGEPSRLTPEQDKERMRKAHESMRITIAKERMRINWGLDQKTKMKLVRAPHKQASYRYMLKKIGYIVDKGSKDIYYPNEEMRKKKVERYAETTHKMRFYSIYDKHR